MISPETWHIPKALVSEPTACINCSSYASTANVTLLILLTKMTDPDDPVVASYDVFLAGPAMAHTSDPSVNQSTSSKVLLLQYPAYRPSSRPYNAAKSQKPSELRLKPNTGIVEIDVPILTREHYNQDSGTRYGRAISDSKILHGSLAHGLAGGFHAGSSQATSLRENPAHDDTEASSPSLSMQTLGGKVTEPSERDPIYFLGSLRYNSIHLSRLDGVVQLRPQLHHLDAEEEISQKRFQVGVNGPSAKTTAEAEVGASTLESRAIEVKLKDTKYEDRDRTMNENTRLLRDIQVDRWRSHNWVDQDHNASHTARDRILVDSELHDLSLNGNYDQLRSSLSNGDWLDKMSAPTRGWQERSARQAHEVESENGHAVRKQKRRRSRKSRDDRYRTSNPGTGPLMEQSSDSEASSGRCDGCGTWTNKLTI